MTTFLRHVCRELQNVVILTRIAQQNAYATSFYGLLGRHKKNDQMTIGELHKDAF